MFRLCLHYVYTMFRRFYNKKPKDKKSNDKKSKSKNLKTKNLIPITGVKSSNSQKI